MGIGYRPDLVIEAVSGPTSVTPGQDFTASVKVCNQGTRAAYADVELVLSEDADIQSPLRPSAEPGHLPHGDSVPGHARGGPVQDAAGADQRLGAARGRLVPGRGHRPGPVRERVPRDQQRAGQRAVGFGYRADFTITAVSGPASVRPGDSFTVDVTVCNQGTHPAPVDVQVVLSEDTTIRLSYSGPPEGQDMPLNGFYLNTLPAGQCQTLQVRPRARASDGLWYLGAVADPGNYALELLENNNTQASKRMGIGYQADFIVSSVTGPPAPRPGQPFTATVTVCNQGTQSGSTDVELYSPRTPPSALVQRASVWAGLPADAVLHGDAGGGPVHHPAGADLRAGSARGRLVPGRGGRPGKHGERVPRDEQHARQQGAGDWPPGGLHRHGGDGPGQRAVRGSVHREGDGVQPGHGAGDAEVQLVLSEDTTIRFSYYGPAAEQDFPLTAFHTPTWPPASAPPSSCRPTRTRPRGDLVPGRGGRLDGVRAGADRDQQHARQRPRWHRQRGGPRRHRLQALRA